MNCMEARRLVTPYVEGELSDRELEQFLRHVEHCRDCMDELDIYFTVYRAMDLLDTGGKPDYDFKKMLYESIRASKRRLFLHRTFRAVRMVAVFAADLLLALSVAVGVQIRRGAFDETAFRRVWLNFYLPAEQVIEQESEISTEEISELLSELVEERHTLTLEGSTLPQGHSTAKADTQGMETEYDR